jgi:signal transduction histidine kinase
MIAGLKGETQSIVSEIRNIVHGLRPPSLDVLGLVPALQTHFDQLSAADSLKFELNADPMIPRLSAAIEVAAYRIVLEAATNVIQHAGAGACRVTISIAGGQLHLAISDDGNGIRDERNTGIGLRSMASRAEELGGRFSIESSAAGTSVLAALPLR